MGSVVTHRTVRLERVRRLLAATSSPVALRNNSLTSLTFMTENVTQDAGASRQRRGRSAAVREPGYRRPRACLIPAARPPVLRPQLESGHPNGTIWLMSRIFDRPTMDCVQYE